MEAKILLHPFLDAKDCREQPDGAASFAPARPTSY